jgi:hypothetical protein
MGAIALDPMQPCDRSSVWTYALLDGGASAERSRQLLRRPGPDIRLPLAHDLSDSVAQLADLHSVFLRDPQQFFDFVVVAPDRGGWRIDDAFQTIHAVSPVSGHAPFDLAELL